MRLAPDIVEEHAPAGPFVPSFVRSFEAAVAARLPVFAPWLPLISRMARFLAVGVVGLAADTGVFALLFHQGAGAPFSRAVSLVVATVVTWFLNRLFTFGPSGHATHVEIARYFGVALFAQGFNYLVFLGLHYASGETRPYASLFIAAALTAAFSFTGQSLFAFARSGATAPRIKS